MDQIPKTLIGCLLELTRPGSSVGQHRSIINALHSFPLAEAEPILPQLLNCTMTHSCDGAEDCVHLLKRFLVTLAAQSLYLGLRLCWLLESCQPQYDASELSRSRALGLKETLKNAAVTHSPSWKAASLESEKTAKRAELLDRQITFVRQLTKISGKLASMQDKASRKAELRAQLELLNPSLAENRVLFPLATSKSPLHWIVRVVSSECVVFSSRERAPYLLIIETITDPTLTYADPAAEPQPTTNTGDETNKSTEERRESDSEGINKSRAGDRGSRSQELDDSSLSPNSSSHIGSLSVVFGESSAEKAERIRKQSPFGSHPSWRLQAMVVKAGDDLRQEEFALQVIDYVNRIWSDAGVTSLAYPYTAVATDPSSGLIQCVTDSLSFDSVKKSAQVQSIGQFFCRAYGGEGTPEFDLAQRNFIESMAAYSVVCYLMQIKDRHNGNLLLNRNGQLIHIDFGFMLATSPGGLNFESAPFKLSSELVEVMGGVNSKQFNYFRLLLFEAFRTVRARADEVLALVEIMVPQSTLPCFGGDPLAVLAQLKSRLYLNLSDVQLAAEIKQMIDISADNWRTRRYDQFQTWQNGII